MNEDGAVPKQGGPPLGDSARQPAYVPPTLEAEAGDDPAEQRAPYTSWSEQELAEALRSRVAGIGLAGPAQDGPERIRHAVQVRRRNRQVLAGSATVLIVAVVVFLTGGDRFPLTPTLTGAGGAGGGAVSSGPTDGSAPQGSATAAGNGAHIVFPSPGDHRTGPAIGPVQAATSVPASAHSSAPLCSSSTLSTQITLGPTIGGITYGHVDATAQADCVAVGPPSLTISNQASTAVATVVILKEDVATAPGLPAVGTWGTTLALSAGQSLEFQFAWLPLPCTQTGSSASAAGSVSTASPPDPAATVYSLSYIPSGTLASSTSATLNAQCGADVFVTDMYQPGAQPLPSAPPPPASTPGQPAVSADPSPSGGDGASGSASPSTSASASPAPSSSSVTADGSAVVTSNAAPGPKPSG
jgi:hypothetical protein